MNARDDVNRRLRSGALAFVVGLPVACTGPEEEPRARGEAPESVTLNPASATPEFRWSRPCDAPGLCPVINSGIRRRPLFKSLQDAPGIFPVEDGAGGAVLIDGGWLTCVDGHTGRLRWSRPVQSSDAQSIGTSEGLYVYDRSRDAGPLDGARGRLTRIRPSDGAVQGDWDLLPATDLMLAAGGRAMLVGAEEYHGIDGVSGTRIWSHEFRPAPDHKMEILAAAVGRDGLALQVWAEDRTLPRLELVDIDTGAVRWVREGRPLAVFGGHVMSLATEDLWCSLRAAFDGSETRALELEGREEGFAACGEGRFLYVARQRRVDPARVVVGRDGATERPPAYPLRRELLALDLADGRVVWFAVCPDADPRLRVFVSGDRVGLIVTATGAASAPPPGEGPSGEGAARPVPPGDAERLTLLDLVSGVPLCSIDVPSGILKVHVFKDRALIRSKAGWVHCVEWVRR